MSRLTERQEKKNIELVDAYGETFATIQDIIKPEPMKETVCPRCGQNPCVCSETYDIESMTEAKDKKGKGSGTKDACYHKVKSRYSVWPSAYASGALVKCRKVGAANWGNKTKKEGFSNWREDMLLEGLEDKLRGMSASQIQDLIKSNPGAEEKIRKTLKNMRTATPNPQGKGAQLPNVPKQPASTSNVKFRTTGSVPKPRIPRIKMRGGKLGLALTAAGLAAPIVMKGIQAIKKRMEPDIGVHKYMQKEGYDLEAAGLIQLNEKGQKCWKGYEKKGTKKMFGKTYNNCVKKEEFVAEEESDRRKDERQERGGVDGNTDYKRPAKNNTNKFGTGKTAMQKEMEKKHGKGKSAMDIVMAEIRAKHKKKEDKKENTNEERIRINQNGHTYAVMLNWRGKTYTVQIFFPELRKPTRQEVEDKIRKIYPDAKVTYFAPKEFDPADPTVMVGEQMVPPKKPGKRDLLNLTPTEKQMDNLIRLSNRPGVRSALMTGKPVYPYSEQIQPEGEDLQELGGLLSAADKVARDTAGKVGGEIGARQGRGKFGNVLGIPEKIGRQRGRDTATGMYDKAKETIGGVLNKNSYEPEGEVIDERKMTDGEMQKEKKLRKKYDKGDMKKSMKDQYGEEEGKKIYFAKIRKIAMEGKYSSSVRATYGGKTETFPVEVYKKKSKQTKVAEGKGDPCWDTHKQVGMKKKGGRMVPNCVPKEEAVLEMASEKKIDKKLQKPVDTKKLNPADYIKNTRMMPGSGIEKKIAEDWQKKSGKNPEGGLNEKGRKSYERENPGSDLKAPTKKKGNPRRASFCARMKGMKKKLTSKKTANDPDSRINKSLRKWDC